MEKTKKIALAGLLFAMYIVLSRFLSIKTPFVVIGFSFVPIMMCAVLLGAKWTILISTLGDIVGALLFPFGQYFIGFTISAFLTGIIFGIILYKNPIKTYTDKHFMIRLIISSLLVSIFINLLLDSLWLSILYQKAYILILPVRIIKEIVLLFIQVPIIYLIEKSLRKSVNKYLLD